MVINRGEYAWSARWNGDGLASQPEAAVTTVSSASSSVSPAAVISAVTALSPACSRLGNEGATVKSVPSVAASGEVQRDRQNLRPNAEASDPNHHVCTGGQQCLDHCYVLRDDEPARMVPPAARPRRVLERRLAPLPTAFHLPARGLSGALSR